MGAAIQGFIRDYIHEKQKRGDWSKSSVKMPRTALGTLAGCFGKRPIAQLGEAAIDRWITEIAALAPSTRRNYVNVVRAFCRWLLQRGHIRKDPCWNIARVKRPRTVVHVVGRDEALALWVACETDRDRAIYALMYVVGLRCVDCSRLNLDDWDRINGLLIVTGKGMHERFVPVIPATADILRRHTNGMPSSGPMFPSCKGGRLTAQTISERMSLLMYNAGIKTGPRDGKSAHALRRTAATETLIASNDLRATQNLLGHADLASMAAYIARASVGEMATAVNSRFEVA